MPPSEPDFDSPGFDLIDCINKRFPNEQSLAAIEDHILYIKDRISQHNEEISNAIRTQNIIERSGREELERATKIIKELMQRIYDMKSQAKKSEQTVNEITCDIKQLDNAKKNLTSAVTMLNNLHILVESVEKLKEIYNKNEYRQTASILASTQDVMKQFSNYKHIPQINHLSKELDRLCDNITERINLDFRRVFEVPNAKQSISKHDIKLVAEACLVVSLLGEPTCENLIEWFLDLQLTEYIALFKDSQLNLSSLGGVDKRYAWLKKHLLEFEEKYGFLFPPQWRMSERMVIKFCEITRESLTRIMNSHPNEVKYDSYVFAITKTTAFEALLTKRFNASDLCIPTQEGVAPVTENAGFEGIISSSFEKFSHVFTKAQESAIQKLMEQSIDEHNKMLRSVNKDDPSVVFSSSNHLFQQYKSSLLQCVQLTKKSALLDLHEVFKKYLRDYAFKVLQLHLKAPNLNSTTSLNKLSSDASGGKMFSAATYGAAGLLQSLLRDDAGRYKIEPNQVCSVILTADYCLETTQQLETKLKETIDSAFVNQVDLNPEIDIFNELINGCIQILIRYMELGCEGGFSSMIKTQWSSVQTPIGHSPFVDEITRSLQSHIPMIRNLLREGRKYFMQLCNKFITLFTHKYITNLFRCRLLSRGGAEQLLLDTHTLKKFLINLPCYDSDIKTAPASYTKATIKGMSKAEMVLKVVLVPHNTVESFVESYYKLLPESNLAEFQRILEVKGVKKNEASQLVAAYNSHIPDTRGTS